MRWLLIVALLFASACKRVQKDVIVEDQVKIDGQYEAKKDLIDPDNRINVYDRRGRPVGYWKRDILNPDVWKFHKENR